MIARLVVIAFAVLAPISVAGGLRAAADDERVQRARELIVVWEWCAISLIALSGVIVAVWTNDVTFFGPVLVCLLSFVLSIIGMGLLFDEIGDGVWPNLARCLPAVLVWVIPMAISVLWSRAPWVRSARR